MKRTDLSNAGRWMMDRRQFLRYGGTGLSGVALAALLAKDKLIANAADTISNAPVWSPEHPHAARPPHFTPKAKNILVIFARARVRIWKRGITNPNCSNDRVNQCRERTN